MRLAPNLTVALLSLSWLMTTMSFAIAQPAAPPTTQSAPSNVERYPRVKLVYYVREERGGRKEIQYIDLNEWASDKDVFIEYGWTEPPPPRKFNDQGERVYELPTPRERIWKIRYEPAGEADQSRLFISGIGGRAGRARIYNTEDLIQFLYIVNIGWHELGVEGRFLRENPQSTPSPLPTRSQ